MFFLRTCTIFCMREAVTISYHSRILPSPPRPLKRPKHFNLLFVFFQLLLFWPKGTNNPTNIPPNVSYENCSHFWENFRFFGGSIFRFGGSKQIFNLCSHIELITQNPYPIFKIAICFTKTPNMPKHFQTFGKFSKI